MNTEIRKLAPQEVWQNFAELNQVPRPSKKEEKVIAFILNFAQKLGLPATKDKAGNIVVRKPATAGFENRKSVILQAHLDMVCQKNNDTEFDFETQGIQMYIDGDWVRAKRTTLGADNGMGVAAIMAVLQSQTLAHPPLEALFTIDEEMGMTGAKALEKGFLHGEILLNLDTEEDDEIDIGCAGGVDITAQRKYAQIPTPENTVALQISVKGLKGGHSGMDIDKGRANANKLMNRLLYHTYENYGLHIAWVQGGGLRNAIPRESVALVVVSSEKQADFQKHIEHLSQEIKEEYAPAEENIQIEITPAHLPQKVMHSADQQQVIRTLYAAHNGVYQMSRNIAGLVETSNNIANVQISDGKIAVKCLTRSSVESSKADLANALRSAFELSGFQVKLSGDYPGWRPNPQSPILHTVENLYQKMFAHAPKVVACHAGLECGIIGRHYPQMDMISFGPTILGAHSPEERVNIPSVQKFWNFLQEILKNIPEK